MLYVIIGISILSPSPKPGDLGSGLSSIGNSSVVSILGGSESPVVVSTLIGGSEGKPTDLVMSLIFFASFSISVASGAMIPGTLRSPAKGVLSGTAIIASICSNLVLSGILLLGIKEFSSSPLSI